MAESNFSGPLVIGDGDGQVFTILMAASYEIANLPDPNLYETPTSNGVVFVTDATNVGGNQGALCYAIGGRWYDISTGVPVA